MSVVRPPEFDPRWRRKRRWQQRWRSWRAWIAVGAIVAASIWYSLLSREADAVTEYAGKFTICSEQGSAACMIDGDTLAIGRRRIRLTGYDAPEIDGACRAEEAKAIEARDALHEWLNDGPVLFDGGEAPPRDQYGRELRGARRIVDGQEEWLSDWMVDRGLGQGNGWTDASIEWCPAD